MDVKEIVAMVGSKLHGRLRVSLDKLQARLLDSKQDCCSSHTGFRVIA